MAELTDNKLIRLIKYAPALIVALFTLLWVGLGIKDRVDNSNADLNALYEQHQQRQESLLKAQVEHVASQIEYARSRTEQELKTTIKQRVREAHAIASRLYEQNRHLPESEVTAIITSALRDIRFNNGRGYFFIYKSNGINVMHPLLPHIEETSMWDFKDVRGSYVVRELGQQVKTKGETYHRWWFVKPDNTNQEFEKIGFGKYFAPYDWFIGTGDYVVDVESDIQQRVLEWARDLRFGKYGYVFIFSQDGEILTHIDGSRVGINALERGNPQIRQDVQRLLSADGEFVRYKADYLPQGVTSPDKTSYVIHFPAWNWVIGSGVYDQETEAYLLELSQRAEEGYRAALIRMGVIGGVTTIIIALLSLGLSRIIASRFERFQHRINQDFTHLQYAKEQLEHMALHDALTGLPNRVLLNDHIRQGIEISRKNYRQLAVMFVDLDDFKKVNDLYGHTAGDELLSEISTQFESRLEDGDMIARFGGDEFIFCFPCLESLNEAEKKVEMIQQVFSQQFVIQGKVMLVTCTIGVSMFPSDGDEPEELISRADIVLYKSKARQKGDVLFFNNEINRQVQYDFLLERELSHAVEREELSVLYQPQIDSKTGKLCGVEALLRWHNQQLGHVSPAEFIPVAEDTGLIDELGMFVLDRACKDINQLFPCGESKITLSVNLSPAQMLGRGFLPRLQEIAQQNAISCERLILEITENVFINDLAKVTPVIESIRELGFSISLDDFGTGYSSLSYLSNLPINEIKIDRSFIDQMLSSAQSDSLVKAIIAIGRAAEMKVVAEGVETQAQYDVLRSYGCDIVQGYFFDRPLTLSQLQSRYAPGGDSSV